MRLLPAIFVAGAGGVAGVEGGAADALQSFQKIFILIFLYVKYLACRLGLARLPLVLLVLNAAQSHSDQHKEEESELP